MESWEFFYGEEKDIVACIWNIGGVVGSVVDNANCDENDGFGTSVGANSMDSNVAVDEEINDSDVSAGGWKRNIYIRMTSSLVYTRKRFFQA